MQHEGYVNQLASPCDLRQFAIDLLTRVTETAPAGKETKPGVWLAPGASIEKGARLLAPSFIGAFARIRTGAVITRCASIESHAVIDCGTVVENSTVLPYSYIGAGLDLAHSLAGKQHIANLRRDVTAEIADPRLMAAISETSGKKMLDAATEFLAFLPRMVLQSIVSTGKKPVQPDLNTTLHKGSPSLGDAHGYEASACDPEAASKFPNMVVARRYGHQ
jgi:NDP-sugar pyrophosphorylase family protein